MKKNLLRLLFRTVWLVIRKVFQGWVKMDMSKIGNEDLFKLGFDLGKAITAKLLSYEDRDGDKIIQIFFFSKSFKTFQVISILSKNGYPEDCMPLIRTMFEIKMQYAYLLQNPKAQAKLFWDYSSVFAFQTIKKVTKHDPAAKAKFGEDIDGRIQELQKRYDDVIGSYKSNKASWTGLKLSCLAKKVGMEREYDVVYFALSNYAHTAQSMLDHYITQDGSVTKPNWSPSKNDDLMVGFTATGYLLKICEFLNSTFGLGLEGLISENLMKLNKLEDSYEPPPSD